MATPARRTPAPPSDGTRGATLRRVLGAGLSLWLLAGGLAIAWTALVAIRSYAWPQPTMDQFRLYRIYLEQPFPQNLLQLENQHRPVVPGLLRVAEMRWAEADQSWQIAIGAAFALLTALCIALAALRERSWPWPARAAGAAAACIGVFWLGNARMLMHGNELVHAYLVTLSAVAAAWAVWRAGFASPWRWMTLAALAASVATFCFGPGIALFPALLIVAWLQRVPAKTWSMPIAACIACLVLYLFVLPGDQGVRSSLALDPARSLETAARWIASPWINAWLGFADPPLNPIHAQHLAQHFAPWLVSSANAVQEGTGLSWSVGLAATLGAFGFTALAVIGVFALPRSRELALVEAIALMLMLFGAASALVIGIGRLDYLQQHPMQIFADRYLIWPCLFWLGLLLRMLGSGRVARAVAIVALLALPPLLWPTQQVNAGWAAASLRVNASSAPAARADVFDRDVFWPDDPSVSLEDKLRALQLFRERGLAMYAGTGMRLLGDTWDAALERDEGIVLRFAPPVPVQDLRDARAAARFSGVIERGRERVGANPALLVLDARRRVVGYAAPTHPAGDAAALRWTPAARDGIDGYINGYDASASYRVILLASDAGRAFDLGPLTDR